MTEVAEKTVSETEAFEIKVARAEDAMERAARLLQNSCNELEALGAGAEGDVIKDIRSLNAALQFTMGMQEKAREAGIERFGKSGQGQLDLGDARSEIGLRLACLRERGNGSEVS